MKILLRKDLGLARQEAKEAVDRQANEQRAALMSHHFGEAIEYLMQVAEAEKCALDPSPKGDDYPMLNAERQARLLTAHARTELKQVAEDTLKRHKAWQQSLAEIKRLRRARKLLIDAAKDPDSIKKAKQATPDKPADTKIKV